MSDHPYIILERGDCAYCDGKGKTWYGGRVKQLEIEKKCWDCNGTGKVDREVDLKEALQHLGVVFRGDTI